MAGRGSLSEAGPLDTKGGRLKVLRNGRWQQMYRPVNPDRPFSGTSLCESFAAAYADAHAGVEVGIIPCADGGTTLDQWREGGLLFDNAVSCARLAMRTSHLVGILWHQGEGDCGAYDKYFDKISAMMGALRRELGDPELPLVVGGLGDFLKDMKSDPSLANYPHINDALARFVEQSPATAFASAKGLTSNPDNLHFNHASLQEFGRRYYEAFKTVENKARVFDEKSKMDDAIRTAMVLL